MPKNKWLKKVLKGNSCVIWIQFAYCNASLNSVFFEKKDTALKS